MFFHYDCITHFPVFSSPLGKRQHLAVSHEKGKVTILQLSALLKQADSSKRKLTLTVREAALITSLWLKLLLLYY